MELRSQTHSLKTNPQPNPPTSKLYTWYRAAKQVPVPLATTKTTSYSVGCQMEKCDSSLQRKPLHGSRVQWWRALHSCIQHFALCLMMEVLDEALYTLFSS